MVMSRFSEATFARHEKMIADRQPLGVLVEHRVDDVGERLVGAEEPVPAGEHIAFQHAFERVLAEHLDDAAVGGQFAAVGVFGKILLQPEFLRHLVDRVELVGRVLVRAEDAEILHVVLHHVAEEHPQRTAVLGLGRARLLDRDPVIAEVRHSQALLQSPAIGVRIRSDAPGALGSERLELRPQAARVVEQFLRLVRTASSPPACLSRAGSFFTSASGTWCARQLPSRRCPPTSAGLVQPLGVRRTIIGHCGRSGVPLAAGLAPAAARISATHVSIVAAIAWCIVSGSDPSTKYGVQPVPRKNDSISSWRHARPDRRVVDLVSVQMKDRQDGAVANRVEELVDVPARGQRAGLRLAVADDGRDDQIGIVERGPAGVREHVAQFAAFVDAAGRFRRAVAADAAGKGKLLEERSIPCFVLAAIRVDLGVRPFQIARPQHARSAVSRPGHEDDVQIVALDCSAQMDVGERQARTGSPMAEQPVLDVLRLQRLLQQRIRLQVGHSKGKIVARPPEGIDVPRVVLAQRRPGDRCAGGPVSTECGGRMAIGRGRFLCGSSRRFRSSGGCHFEPPWLAGYGYGWAEIMPCNDWCGRFCLMIFKTPATGQVAGFILLMVRSDTNVSRPAARVPRQGLYSSPSRVEYRMSEKAILGRKISYTSWITQLVEIAQGKMQAAKSESPSASRGLDRLLPDASQLPADDHALQQHAVLTFGRRTNAQPPLAVLMQDAATLVSEVLHGQYGGVGERKAKRSSFPSTLKRARTAPRTPLPGR